MILESRPSIRMTPILVILLPGALIFPSIWFFAPQLAGTIDLAWLINLVVFIPPWLLLTLLPGLRSAPVVLAISGLRLVCLPMLLLALKNGTQELAPALLGWTLGLYLLNMTTMTVMESRIRF